MLDDNWDFLIKIYNKRKNIKAKINIGFQYVISNTSKFQKNNNGLRDFFCKAYNEFYILQWIHLFPNRVQIKMNE